jgi:HSP20 family molecular chaperone IbpA
MSKRKNPLDESLTELMDAWMELLSIPKRFQGVIPDIAKQVPTMNPKQHIGDWEDRNGDIAITIDMPGVQKKDIELTVDKHMVKVQAKAEDRDYNFEKEFNSFTTTLDPSKVTANFNNGVLDITIEKAEVSKGKKIAIK